jgi:hypothetical protein
MKILQIINQSIPLHKQMITLQMTNQRIVVHKQMIIQQIKIRIIKHKKIQMILLKL